MSFLVGFLGPWLVCRALHFPPSPPSDPAGLAPTPAAPRAGRFNRALESIKQGEDMWVLLSGTNIHDAKARKV